MSPRCVAAAVVASLALLIGSSGIALADPVGDIAGEPDSVGDAKIAAIAYHDSGLYQDDLAVVAARAIERAAIEAEGYTIVANSGDQPSDPAGGHSEQTRLLPDPFYRIP